VRRFRDLQGLTKRNFACAVNIRALCITKRKFAPPAAHRRNGFRYPGEFEQFPVAVIVEGGVRLEGERSEEGES
jgi:hypothetical protein